MILISAGVVAIGLFGLAHSSCDSASKFSTDLGFTDVCEDGAGAVPGDGAAGKSQAAWCEGVLDGVRSG